MKESEHGETAESKMFLAVRIRGTVGDNPDIQLTLKSLGLEGKFNARLVPSKPEMVGMLKRAKDLLTWGELDQQTLSMILTKRAETMHSHYPRVDSEFAKTHFQVGSVNDLATGIIGGDVGLDQLAASGVRSTIRLHPPKGGFKRSTRRPYNSNGELGYRGREINRLVRRMI